MVLPQYEVPNLLLPTQLRLSASISCNPGARTADTLSTACMHARASAGNYRTMSEILDQASPDSRAVEGSPAFLDCPTSFANGPVSD